MPHDVCVILRGVACLDGRAQRGAARCGSRRYEKGKACHITRGRLQ